MLFLIQMKLVHQQVQNQYHVVVFFGKSSEEENVSFEWKKKRGMKLTKVASSVHMHEYKAMCTLLASFNENYTSLLV